MPSTHGGLPPTSFADSISTGSPGAHGVPGDDVNALLPAIGDEALRAYRLVTNSGDVITGLSRPASLSFTGTGHDLQPDCASEDILHTVGEDAGNPDHGMWKTRLVHDNVTGAWSFASPTRPHDRYFTESSSRLPDPVRTGAKFYAARFWSHVLTRPHGTGAHRHR
ncbi:hypothetical protein ABT269_00015 [Streptomyces viridosporus]|uniref:hypothetical protein n=1 Tax=Streptomyces viridosporus TaxID=67581 RepID=UPI003332534A